MLQPGPLIVCVGTAVLDRVFELDALPARNGKQMAHARHDRAGGIASTAAVAVAALGGRAAWCGPVGDDGLAPGLLRQLAMRGVDTSGARVVAGARTPVSAVLVDQAGDCMIVVDRDPALRYGRCDVAVDAAAVLADPRHPEAALDALAQARGRGIPGVLDADEKAGPLLPALIAASSHAIFARAALACFTGQDDPAAGLRAAAGTGMALLGVTLGEEGSLFLIEGCLHAVPAVPAVPVRDTTGCGDVFHGAFALGLAEGMAPLDAARLATAAASLKASRGQGWDGMASRAEVAAAARRGLVEAG